MENNFEKKFTHNQVLFRYAKGKSLASGYEIHPYNEILFFIDGGGRLLTEYFEEELRNGTLIIIPKNAYHQIVFSDEPNYMRLVLNFPDIEAVPFPQKNIRLLYPIPRSISFLLERIRAVLESDICKEITGTLLYGAFLMLLAETYADSPQQLSPKLRRDDDFITKCIKYIDDNFTSDLSVEKIAKEMSVSPATIFSGFKKQLGTSIHRYITEKRLIYAHNLITNNNPPTKIYLDCGYRDYASFYRAFVKMFGYPPSQTKPD